MGPYVLLVKRRTFDAYKLPKVAPKYPLNREAALEVLLDQIEDRDVIVSTTGMLSRELSEQRVKRKMGHEKDFLTVGSMGHASSIALGVSIAKPRRRVICLDGDGATLMHMGALTTIAAHASPNFKHVLFNNSAHDSVGGQPTSASEDMVDYQQIAKACGYKMTLTATTPEEIREAYKTLVAYNAGPALLEIKIAPGGHRKNLGRPTKTPIQNKTDFMKHLDRV